MPVICRKENESIVVTLKHVGLRNGRLVIEAPRTLKISSCEPQASVPATPTAPQGRTPDSP